MPPFNFCGPSYTAQSPIIDDELAMNCFCEASESKGAATPMALLRTPGRKKFVTLSEGKVPGSYEVNGRVFFAGANLWEVNASGLKTNRGSLGAAPTTPTMLTSNETQLVVLNNGNLFVLTLSTNVFVAVDMGQFNGPVSQIGFNSGYIVATIQNSHTFQVSALEDATTWSGLDIATLSYAPDNIMSMICDHNETWLWSGKKAFGYYVSQGLTFPPLIPIQGALMENGAGATYATVQADNSVFWLDQDERGYMVARRLNGYNGDRISTHAVELAWQQFKTASDAVGWTYQERGHTFWVLYFPTANATWCYDISQNLWHQRGFWVEANGSYIADRAMCHVFAFGKHLVGDWASGNVYELSANFYDDDGAIIRGNRRSPTVDEENKWIYYDQIEFVMETGLAPSVPLFDGDDNPRPPQLMLRWSSDGGKTWSNTYYLSVGFQGEYNKRVIKRMLGRARKRLWDVSWTDPYPYAFNDAFVKGEAAIQ
ncbi:MAG TPA: hypothetical protein VGG46_04065 [Terriglobales bacterium]|jgi:hypothetical protein